MMKRVRGFGVQTYEAFSLCRTMVHIHHVHTTPCLLKQLLVLYHLLIKWGCLFRWTECVLFVAWLMVKAPDKKQPCNEDRGCVDLISWS